MSCWMAAVCFKWSAWQIVKPLSPHTFLGTLDVTICVTFGNQQCEKCCHWMQWLATLFYFFHATSVTFDTIIYLRKYCAKLCTVNCHCVSSLPAMAHTLLFLYVWHFRSTKQFSLGKTFQAYQAFKEAEIGNMGLSGQMLLSGYCHCIPSHL